MYLSDARVNGPQHSWNVLQLETGIQSAAGPVYSLTQYTPESRRTMMLDVVNAMVSEAGFTVLGSHSVTQVITTIPLGSRALATYYDGAAPRGTDYDTDTTPPTTSFVYRANLPWPDNTHVWWSQFSQAKCPWVHLRAPASMGSFELVISLKNFSVQVSAEGQFRVDSGCTFICRMGESGTWQQAVGDEAPPLTGGGEKWGYLTNQSHNINQTSIAGPTPSYNGLGWIPADDGAAPVRFTQTTPSDFNLTVTHQYHGLTAAVITDDDKKWCFIAFSQRTYPGAPYAPCGLWVFGKKPVDATEATMLDFIDPSLRTNDYEKFFGGVGFGIQNHGVSSPAGLDTGNGRAADAGPLFSDLCKHIGTGLAARCPKSGAAFIRGSDEANYAMSADQWWATGHSNTITRFTLRGTEQPQLYACRADTPLVLRGLSGVDTGTVPNLTAPFLGMPTAMAHYCSIEFTKRYSGNGGANSLSGNDALHAFGNLNDSVKAPYTVPLNHGGARNFSAQALLVTCTDPTYRGDTFYVPDMWVTEYEGRFCRMVIPSDTGSWLFHGGFVLPWEKDVVLTEDTYDTDGLSPLTDWDTTTSDITDLKNF